MTIFLAFLLVLALAAGWLLTLVGMPGNWLMAAATAAYAYLAPPASRAAIGWKVVAVLFVLALLGEILELVAGAVGATKAGGTRRGALLAVLGSIIGGILGVIVGLPVPMVGSFIAALLFAGLGALAGAMLDGYWAGQDMRVNWQVGKAAFWGRLAGTMGKTLVGALMGAIVVAALLP
jgi:uncharacterized protein